VFDVKRLIGRRFRDKTVQSDLKLLPFSIVNKDGSPFIQVQHKGSRKQFAPEEISASVLRYMKEQAEKYLGEEVFDAVVTVPAYFNNAQREATKDAGRIAGLTVQRIINEPTAAAVAYGLDQSGDAQNILVYDLGGGTFDVSVMVIDDGIFEVQATNGNTHLGGEDFDQRLVNYFLDIIKKKYKKDLSSNPRALSKLRREVEKAKRALSSVTQVRVEIESLLDGGDFSETLTRAKFEELNKDLFDKTLKPVANVLKDSGLETHDINEIVLVGGSTRIPRIRQLITKFFNGKKPHTEINPDEAIAYGATIQGGILSGDGPAKDIVLLDVTPMSLGVAEVGGVFSKIIDRNTVIPVKKSSHYTTVDDYQDALAVEVFQGERANVKHNILLGKFDLEIPPAPRGVPDIKVTFEIDANGILHVEAQDLASGNKGRITITAETGRLSQEEIERMVEDADKNAESDRLFRERNEARTEAEFYAYKIKKQFTADKKVTKYLSKADKTRVMKRLNALLSYVDEHIDDESVTKEDFVAQQRKVEEVVNPALSRAYEARKKARKGGKGAPVEEETDDDNTEEPEADSEDAEDGEFGEDMDLEDFEAQLGDLAKEFGDYEEEENAATGNTGAATDGDNKDAPPTAADTREDKDNEHIEL
jgi:endoplasmic reticulum chaperone BiP